MKYFIPKSYLNLKKNFERQTYKNILILYQQSICKNRENLIPLLSKTDDLPLQNSTEFQVYASSMTSIYGEYSFSLQHKQNWKLLGGQFPPAQRSLGKRGCAMSADPGSMSLACQMLSDRSDFSLQVTRAVAARCP